MAVIVGLAVISTSCSDQVVSKANTAIAQAYPKLAAGLTRRFTKCPSHSDWTFSDGSGYVTGWIDPPLPEGWKVGNPSPPAVRFLVVFESGKKATDVLFDLPGRTNVLTIMRQLQAAHDLKTSAEYDCWTLYQDAWYKVIEINEKTGHAIKDGK